MADPGFPRGGGTNSPGGRQHTILPKIPKNWMNLKEFGPQGGRGASLAPSLNLPLEKRVRKKMLRGRTNSMCDVCWPLYRVSSGRVRGGGAEKHEIYAAAFRGHLFYMTYFHRAREGGHGPLAPRIRYCPPPTHLGLSRFT